MGVTDEELPDYCYWHCRTDLGLFSKEQIIRLLELADDSRVDQARQLPEFKGFGPKFIDPIVETIRNHRTGAKG